MRNKTNEDLGLENEHLNSQLSKKIPYFFQINYNFLKLIKKNLRRIRLKN